MKLSVGIVLLAGCAAASAEPVARPVAAPVAPQAESPKANHAVQDQLAREAEAKREAIAAYQAQAARDQEAAEAKVRAALDAQAAREKAAAEAEAARCRDSRKARRQAMAATLRDWQAFALRVGPHRKAILEQCRIGAGGSKVTPLGRRGAVKVQALSVDERVECRGGGVPGGVSNADAVTTMQVDYEDPIDLDEDRCAKQDATDGEPIPRTTITDLLGKPKP